MIELIHHKHLISIFFLNQINDSASYRLSKAEKVKLLKDRSLSLCFAWTIFLNLVQIMLYFKNTIVEI